MNVVNSLVYNERLQCGNDEVAMGHLHLPHLPTSNVRADGVEGWIRRILAPHLPVLFLDTDGCSGAKEDMIAGQICNRFEANLTARLVMRLIKVSYVAAQETNCLLCYL